MANRWSVIVGMLVIVSILSLGLAEVILRVTRLASPPGVLTVTERQAARTPGAFVPRGTVTERKDARFPHEVTINSLGYRGAHVRRKPSVGRTRVLFVGDSFTWGDLVDDHETAPARLEVHLQSFCPGVEVINAGVGGTTIDAHREMIRRGLEIEPDLIVLMFYENDLMDLRPPTFWDLMLKNRHRKSQFPVSAIYAVLNRTALWTLIRRARARFGTQIGGGGGPADDASGLPEEAMTALKGVYRNHLVAVAGDLRRRGIPFVLTGFPAHLTLQNVDARSNHIPWLSKLASQVDIRYVDLLSALLRAEEPLTDLYFLPWDGHPRPKAYDIAAMELSQGLRSFNPQTEWCDAGDD